MRILYPLPGAEALAADLSERLGAALGRLAVGRFPDGEHHVRVDDDPVGREAILVADLARPDAVLLPLLFAADTLRDLRASRVSLVAPYLPYMRQDRRFHAGEAVSSMTFARLLSRAVDDLTTIDPHLHRRASLGEIFNIPTRVVHAASLVGAWIADNVEKPLVIGPDAESGQWAREAALHAQAPCVLLSKVRQGDREVVISGPDLTDWRGHTPVIVDDIISSGATIRDTAEMLSASGLPPPVVVAVHALISTQDQARLAPQIARLVSTATVPHASNAMAITGLLAEALNRPPM